MSSSIVTAVARTHTNRGHYRKVREVAAVNTSCLIKRFFAGDGCNITRFEQDKSSSSSPLSRGRIQPRHSRTDEVVTSLVLLTPLHHHLLACWLGRSRYPKAPSQARASSRLRPWQLSDRSTLRSHRDRPHSSRATVTQDSDLDSSSVVRDFVSVTLWWESSCTNTSSGSCGIEASATTVVIIVTFRFVRFSFPSSSGTDLVSCRAGLSSV
jgi:hypothetical protein